MADLLRLVAAGSVDDGKSTVVGRLLHDTRALLADEIVALGRASRATGEQPLNLALITDGLRAERERGITIDVAYRYFATPRRCFIVADTPGHVEYTRNMVTGASTAQAMIVLVDARWGVVEQTRRHTTVAALLGVNEVILVVNKMDLVGDDEAVYTSIATRFVDYATQLGICAVTTIPVSALRGDNVVTPSTHMPWYVGPTLLEHLETLPIDDSCAQGPFRMAVQSVIQPQVHHYHGYAGQVASGVLRVGDPVLVQPGGKQTTVVAIDGLNGALDKAYAPMSVTVRLADDLGITRGDLLADTLASARVTDEVVGVICWFDERPLTVDMLLIVRTQTAVVTARVHHVGPRLDVDTLVAKPVTTVRVNDIAGVVLRTDTPVAVDDYRDNRRTGAFLLLDKDDGATLGAGMVGDRFNGVSVTSNLTYPI